MTASLAQSLRDAAETIEQINAMCGLGINATVSPSYLRKEADRMDGDVA